MAFVEALIEIFNLAILTIAIGFIISGYIKHPNKSFRQQMKRTFFDWDDFKFGLLIAAPGIVLHELAHKFVAIGFGTQATFQIFFIGILLGVFLRMIKSPVLILAPGYVMIPNLEALTPLQTSLVAFGGPFVNLLLWLIPLAILRTQKGKLSRSMAVFLFYTAFLNMWLFIFNMLPIPPLDGSKVFLGLFNTLF